MYDRGLRRGERRVQRIRRPTKGIELNAVASAFEYGLTLHKLLVVAALPESEAGRLRRWTQAMVDGRFESAYKSG